MGWTGPKFAEFITAHPEHLFEVQPLSGDLKETFELLDSRAGRARIRFHLTERHMNYTGRVHGGVISLILDETIGIAGYIHVGEQFKCTVENKVSYFRTLRTGDVTVEAKVAHRTPTMLFMEADVFSPAGSVVARSMATIALKKPALLRAARRTGQTPETSG